MVVQRNIVVRYARQPAGACNGTIAMLAAAGPYVRGLPTRDLGGMRTARWEPRPTGGVALVGRRSRGAVRAWKANA